MTKLYLKPARHSARAVLWRLTAAALAVVAPGTPQAQTAYHGFTLLDPATESVVEHAYIVVDGALIARVGRGAEQVRSGRWLGPDVLEAGTLSEACRSTGPHTRRPRGLGGRRSSARRCAGFAT